MGKLSVSGVSKAFGATLVMRDQSLEVEDGEFVALLGPSGCGKSTLLQIIDGLLVPDAGRVMLDGRNVTGRTGDGRGMVFQLSDLLPWRSALENVAFGLQVAGVPKRARLARARDYLHRVGLAGFEHAWPHQLSGGMQQRVGIARAFCIQPTLLLMDEPFGALDVQTRDTLQNELLQIWEAERKMVLFVTHSVEEALYLADRILVYSKRPTRVLQEIRVPYARPRRESMKLDARFLELRRRISVLLRQDALEDA